LQSLAECLQSIVAGFVLCWRAAVGTGPSTRQNYWRKASRVWVGCCLWFGCTGVCIARACKQEAGGRTCAERMLPRNPACRGPGLSLAGHLKSTLAGQQPSAAAGDCRRISGGVGSREACSCVKLSGWSSQDKLTRRGNVSNALAPALPCANDVVAAVLTAAAGSLAGS
jgi:hypothetical protein